MLQYSNLKILFQLAITIVIQSFPSDLLLEFEFEVSFASYYYLLNLQLRFRFGTTVPVRNFKSKSNSKFQFHLVVTICIRRFNSDLLFQFQREVLFPRSNWNSLRVRSRIGRFDSNFHFECLRDHLFSRYPKFSENVTFLTSWFCVYQEVKNVSFSESFAYVLNEWSLIWIRIRRRSFEFKCK